MSIDPAKDSANDSAKDSPSARAAAPKTTPIAATGATATNGATAAKAPGAAKPAQRSRSLSNTFTIEKRFLDILKKLGVDQVLYRVSERRKYLAPFEMRAAINPQATAQLAEQQYSRFVPFFDGMRNVLVVLPLTLTWLSLAVAALAYDQTLQRLKDGETAPNFFQAWQQGFPQLSSVRFLSWTIPLVTQGQGAHVHYWTFTDMAILDVAILLVMLVLTALSQLAMASAARRARALETYLIKQLHTMSMDSQMWSQNVPDDQPAWASQMLPVIDSLTKTLEEVDTSMDTFGKQMVEQGQVVKAAVGQAGGVPVAVTELLTIYKQAVLLQEALASALPAIQGDLNRVTESQDLTAANWTRLADQLYISTESMAQIADRLTGSDRMREALHQSNMNYAGFNSRREYSFWRRFWPFRQ